MKRALLVEDDRACALGAMNILRSLQFVAERVDGMRHAMMSVGTGKRFAVYIIDLGLAQGDGRELARAIRVAHPDAKIIIWSASEYDESLRKLGVFVPKDQGGRSLRIALEAMFGEPGAGREQ